MRITTNNLPNCPPAVLQAASNSLQPPKRGVYRITELVDAPLIRSLKESRWNELEVEVDRLLESMDGTAWHEFLQKHAPEGTMAEVPFEVAFGDIKVKGCPDAYDPTSETLFDYKKIKSWKFIKQDWGHFEKQLNLYAYFLDKSGHFVRRIIVNYYIKDWSRFKALQSRDYPQRRIGTLHIKKWPVEQAEEFLRERIRLHLLPPTECTDEEKWQDAPCFALRKQGRATAVKVEATLDDLYKYMAAKGIQLDEKYSIEPRPGRLVRCEDWCEVARFCPYYKPQEQQEAV